MARYQFWPLQVLVHWRRARRCDERGDGAGGAAAAPNASSTAWTRPIDCTSGWASAPCDRHLPLGLRQYEMAGRLRLAQTGATWRRRPAARYLRAAAAHRLAETIGEWAFYAAAILIVLALVKRFPWFFKTHVGWRWSIWRWWRTRGADPARPWTRRWAGPRRADGFGFRRGLHFAERRIRHKHQVVGRIESDPSPRKPRSFHRYRSTVSGRGTRPNIRLRHRDDKEGPHPSACLAWCNDGKYFFIGRRYRTCRTPEGGRTVKVEGPYGCFDFIAASPGRSGWQRHRRSPFIQPAAGGSPQRQGRQRRSVLLPARRMSFMSVSAAGTAPGAPAYWCQRGRAPDAGAAPAGAAMAGQRRLVLRPGGLRRGSEQDPQRHDLPPEISLELFNMR